MTAPATPPSASVSRRPALDHPVRKVLYALPDIRRSLNGAALNVQALISHLERVDVDPATWLEIRQLRRDLRVAEMQLDHATRATQDWSRLAANAPSASDGGTS